ncbi:UNVERIFIED_CONTAM: hypothetical protein Slati_1984900 [Sesamum latifolium]|uniref:Transducin/WD40 repeat-like superfamily protein n=1 Tax=Sesamum latifolium TaxID=2727402 RepID=A0AAW2WQ36_9LAMI
MHQLQKGYDKWIKMWNEERYDTCIKHANAPTALHTPDASAPPSYDAYTPDAPPPLGDAYTLDASPEAAAPDAPLPSYDANVGSHDAPLDAVLDGPAPSQSAAVFNSFLGDPGKYFVFFSYHVLAVITGGLDSKLVMWDFSKGRPNKIMDFGSGGDSGQCCNPAFVHALVVPDLDIVDKVGKVCVVARGDGVVNIIDIESELAALKSKMSTKSRLGSKSNPKSRSSPADPQSADQNDRNLRLDYSMGGHVAAVSSVAFSMFGEKGKFIISGGNDKSVKVWNWSKYPDDSGQTSDGNELLSSSISLSRKVNWLCTTPADSENLVVCDTSKVVKSSG